jgi:hypothetical protein
MTASVGCWYLKEQMKFGERRNFRSERTVLVPGPPEEIAVIQEILGLYSQERTLLSAVRVVHNVAVLIHMGFGTSCPYSLCLIINDDSRDLPHERVGRPRTE